MFNFLIIALSILTVIITVITIVMVCQFNSKHTNYKLKEDFKQSKDEVIKRCEQFYLQRLNGEEVRLKNDMAVILAQIQQKKITLNEELHKLEDDVKKAEERRDVRLAEIEQQILEKFDNKSKKEAANLQSITEFYTKRKLEVKEDYEDFVVEITEKKSKLKEELDYAERRQEEIIEQYKRAEQIKQDKDFYRIVLSENAQQDVKKLRKIADELHDPSVIYKLIYKTYYERPFNEMIGRVVQGRGSIGIYKITNLENGRTYIGQTKQAFKERWRTHLKRGVKAEPGTSNKLYNAMWEDGVENFTFEVLAECEATELNQKEKEYIALYHADSWGYNSNSGNN